MSTQTSGLYPLRVTLYLKLKGIESDFDIIDVEMSPEGQTPAPGKPEGYTLPILELERPDSNGNGARYVFQSCAILEYLEDVANQGPNMRGTTPEARARVRECMDVLNEAVAFFGFYCHNASALFAPMAHQEKAAAKQGLDRMHHMFDVLEKLADPVGPFLAHEGEQPTMVDCVALASILFAEKLYSFDMKKGHPALQRLYDAFKKRGMTELDEEWHAKYGPVASQLSVR